MTKVMDDKGGQTMASIIGQEVVEAGTDDAPPPLFTPYTLRGMTLSNRIVFSPMCMYSAEDGLVGDFHLAHLAARAFGGAGLIIAEMTDVSADARISPGCAGMYTPRHRDAWKRIVDFIHDQTDSKIGIQLGHAGRKGATKKMWEGNNEPLPEDRTWQIVAPSAVPFSSKSRTPKEMDRADLDRTRDDFARAAGWAGEAGFDMIELHFAHGYLISSFISPLSNFRVDAYGGSLTKRLRYPLEVFAAIRAAFPDDRPISVRISATDQMEGGTTHDEGVEIARAFGAAGADIICVSSGMVVEGAMPKKVGLFHMPLCEKVKREAGVPTIAVGNLSTGTEMNGIIAEDRADLCAMGKGFLYNPYFPRHAARAIGYAGFAWPQKYFTASAFPPKT